MSDKNLFEYVKGLLQPGREAAAPPPRPAAARPQALTPSAPLRAPDGDATNPATVTRVGRSNDGRDLIMTLGFGTFLVDRETPTICYFDRGAVNVIPTVELESLVEALMSKRQIGEFAMHYVDLLNVSMHELEARRKRPRGGPVAAAPRPPLRPSKKPPRAPAVPDKENPATIVRVGRSKNGADLVMTLGMGTFVVNREQVSLKYFDRGREWDVPDPELQALVDALMAKEDMAEHRYAYIDLLNVASFVQQQRRKSLRR